MNCKLAIMNGRAEKRSGVWTVYDGDIPSLAEGNVRMEFLRRTEPQRRFILVEILGDTFCSEIRQAEQTRQ